MVRGAAAPTTVIGHRTCLVYILLDTLIVFLGASSTDQYYLCVLSIPDNKREKRKSLWRGVEPRSPA